MMYIVKVPSSHSGRCRSWQADERGRDEKVLNSAAACSFRLTPEVHESVAPRWIKKLLDPAGPIVSQEEIERLVPDDIEAQLVLQRNQLTQVTCNRILIHWGLQ